MPVIRRFGAWIWLTVACLAAAALAVLQSASSPSLPLALTSASPDGGLAIRLWLERSGYHLSWQGDSASVRGLEPRTGTFLLLAPQREPSLPEVTALKRWIRQGGTAVLGTDGAVSSLFNAFGLPVAVSPPAPITVIQPALVAPPASNLEGEAFVVGRSSVPGTAAQSRYGPVLVHRRLGRGDVWLLTAPQLLDNRNIAAGENRRLLLNLIGPPGRRLVFATLAPGAASTGASWWTSTSWGIAILFAVLLAVLFRWLGGRRLGPPLIPFSERRRPAAEYVKSMAGLLRRTGRRSEVLQIYQHELRQRLRRRWGTEDAGALPPGVRAEVQTLLAPRGDLSEDALVRSAAEILECEEELSAHV
jgi:hypothetical protein